MNNLQLAVLLSAVDKMSAPLKSVTKNVAALSDKLKESKTALKELEKMQGRMNTFSRTTEQVKRSTRAISDHTLKLENLRRKADKMKSDRADLRERISTQRSYFQQLLSKGESTNATTAALRLGELEKQYEKLNDKIRSNAKSITDRKNKLKASRTEKAKQLLQLRDLNRKLKAAGINTKEFGKHETDLAGKIKLANTALESQKAKLDKLNAKKAAYDKYRGQVDTLKSASTKAQIVGAQSMAAGATILTPIKSAVKDSMEFEDAMLGVARQVEGVKDKMGNLTPKYDEWKQKIFQLSRELPKTTVEIANMVTSAARMGIDENEIEDTIRKNVAMAVAFDVQEGQGDEFTEKMGRVRDNLKLTQQQADALADTINYLDDKNLSKGTEIIDFLNDAAGISNMVKMSDKDLAAWGSTLITAGNEAGKSAKAFGSILTRLGSNKKPVKKALAAIGLNPDDVKKGLQVNASETILKVFKQVQKKIPEHLRLSVLEGLAGGDYNKVFANLVKNPDMVEKQLAQANSAEAQESMDREFQTRMKGLSATYQTFTNSLRNLNIVLGDMLSPALNNLMKKIGPIVDNIRAWVQANPELVRNLMQIAAAIGGTLTVFGALSIGMSFLLYPIARLIVGFNYFLKISKAISIGIKSAGIAFYWLGKIAVNAIVLVGRAMMTNPILAAITLIIGAIILLWQNWDTVKEKLIASWTWLKETAGNLWQNIANAVTEKWEELKIKVGEITDKIGAFFSEKWNGLVDGAKKFGSNMMDKLKEGVLEAFEKVKSSILKTVDWIKEKLGFSKETEQKIEQTKQKVESATANAMNNSAAGRYFEQGLGIEIPSSQKWSGGYAGSGGKYEPKGIYHGGEYIMTKAATSRLGVPLLNALNYGKNALLATGIGMSVATAAPLQVDTRPPLSAKAATVQPLQPMTVNITINAAQGQDERAIARMIAQEMQRIQNQQQARLRSRLGDRE